MVSNRKLDEVSDKITDFNDETKLNLKLHVEHEMESHKKIMPKGLFYGEIHEEIAKAVDEKMAQFTKTRNTDLRPKELYNYLTGILQNQPNLSKKELHYLAYQHLAETADSKFIKKMFNKLKRQVG